MQKNEAFRVYSDYKPALLIVNPVSGKKLIVRHLPQVVRTLMDAGYAVTFMVTGKRGDACEFASKYARDYELVVCTGGDGTLNEVISGLAVENIHVPVGYIPCGSTNDFAMTHGLSSEIEAAAANIVSGRSACYDIGRFGDKYFSYIAAFGAFSWLSYTTDQNLKNLLGHTAYVLDAVKDLSKIKPHHVRITADGIVHEDDYIFGAICNSLSVAGTFELPRSSVDMNDGRFELLLIKVPKTLIELDAIVHSLLFKEYNCPYIEFFHASEIEIGNSDELEWSLDGESSGPVSSVSVRPMHGFLNIVG